MTTLYAFGCSNTYGEGLPDCWQPSPEAPKRHTYAPTPSRLAWPQLTADTLGYECANLAIPGASNKLILHRILNTRFKPNSKVVVCWSYTNRHTVFRTHTLEKVFAHTDPFDITHIERMMTFGPWKTNSEHCRTPEEHKANTAYYKHIHDERDSTVDAWQYIHTADLHLKSLGFTPIHSINNKTIEAFMATKPRYTTATITRHSMETICRQKPKALDGSHPSEQAHREFAQLMARAIQVST